MSFIITEEQTAMVNTLLILAASMLLLIAVAVPLGFLTGLLRREGKVVER